MYRVDGALLEETSDKVEHPLTWMDRWGGIRIVRGNPGVFQLYPTPCKLIQSIKNDLNNENMSTTL